MTSTAITGRSSGWIHSRSGRALQRCRSEHMMSCGPPLRDRYVADAARERQVGKRSVNMPSSPAKPEFNSSETVIVCRDTLPARNGNTHRLDGNGWGQRCLIDVFVPRRDVVHMIFLTQLVYINPGKEKTFQAFENVAIRLISKYGGELFATCEAELGKHRRCRDRGSLRDSPRPLQ